MNSCQHLVFGYSPCTRRSGHTGPHHGTFTNWRTR